MSECGWLGCAMIKEGVLPYHDDCPSTQYYSMMQYYYSATALCCLETFKHKHCTLLMTCCSVETQLQEVKKYVLAQTLSMLTSSDYPRYSFMIVLIVLMIAICVSEEKTLDQLALAPALVKSTGLVPIKATADLVN